MGCAHDQRSEPAGSMELFELPEKHAVFFLLDLTLEEDACGSLQPLRVLCGGMAENENSREDSRPRRDKDGL